MDEGAISRVYQDVSPMMTEVKFLSLMSDSGGGTDSFIYPLLHLALEYDQGYDSLDWGRMMAWKFYTMQC